MARQKHTLIWPCGGGNKRMVVIGKPDFTFSGNYASLAANISQYFATTPGSDGTAIKFYNRIDVVDGIADGSTTKPQKGAAMVCSFTDENGSTHKWRFPQALADDMTEDAQGNTVLEQGAGDGLATYMSQLTGYTLTFVRGWLDRAYQQT